MEATKALAQRLRHRASLRRAPKKTAQNAAGEYRAQAARNAYGKQQQQQETAQAAHPTAHSTANRGSDNEKQSDTSRDNPFTAGIPGPPATAAPANSTASLTISSAFDAPLTPSPGSDISPTSQQPPKLVHDDADTDKAPKDSPASRPPPVDYFTIESTTDTGEGSPGKIPTAVSTKEDVAEGKSQEQRPDLQEDSETAVSSVSPPSTVVSPRESVDDGATDAGRSSIVSFGGGWSRHSSMSSPLAFRLPDGTLPQGRTKTSHKSRHRNSSPSVTSK